MVLREEQMIDLFLAELVRLVLALAALVAHHVALVGQLFPVQLLQQEAHAVALQPQSQLQFVAGHGLEVVGAVEVRGAIDVGRADAFEIAEMRLLAHVLGALKHHVLEQMREAGAALCLVHRPDVIPQVHGNQGQAMVLVQQHGQAIGQRVALIGERGHLQGLRRNELWRGLRQVQSS